MRLYVLRASGRAVGLLCLAVACSNGSTPAAQTAAPTRSASPAAHGPALGLGEPRIPQPFTIEQRLLNAVSHGDRRTIELALERGATLSAKDDLKRSVVLLATLDAADSDLVRWLHDKGAAIDEPDAGGRTALSFAAANGNLDIVRYLLDNGAAVDRADLQRRTPLFHAATGNHIEIARILLDHGANANAQDQFGDTPLIMACSKGHSEMVALLLQRGADPGIKDQEGRTARERAAPGTAGCTAPEPQP